MSDVSVAIPWYGACPYRGLNLDWVFAKWIEDGFTPFVGSLPDEGSWCKAKAIEMVTGTPPLVMGATLAEILVIADGDVWCDVSTAVQAVRDGAPHAIPHKTIHRMDPAATSRVLQGGDFGGPLVQRPYRGVLGGGITVVRRDVYEEVPLDPGFIGWGQEDESWGIALRALAGKGFNGQEELWHLWHPPMERKTRGTGSPESKARRDFYIRNIRHPEVLRQLVKGTPIQEIVSV